MSFRNGSREGVNLTLIQYRMGESVSVFIRHLKLSTILNIVVSSRLEKVPVAILIPSDMAQDDDSSYNVSYLEGEDPAIIWPDGTPPDGTLIEVEHYPFPAVMAVVYLYSCLGVVFALACLTFNLAYRNRK